MIYSETTRVFEPCERIEFGFVLLPDEHVLIEIKEIADLISGLLEPLPWCIDLPAFWGTYLNKSVVIPHVSIGQYGVLGCEIDDVKKIAQEVSQFVAPIHEPMRSELSILEDHIFFDAINCFENVNPEIARAYLMLRARYFENIQTKFPISQALHFKKKQPYQHYEINLINQYFQNWGIPEDNRMRPHFTLLYHPPYQGEGMKKKIEQSADLKKKINKLSEIIFTRMGVVQIDSFGNPLKDGLICAYPLNTL